MLGAIISDKLDADTYAANPKATSGDLVANHMTAAAVSTAMAAVLGSAVKHQPLNVANTAANAIGAAIGTGIGSTFADQLDAHYQQAEKGVEYTKQARRHSASMRTATAAEQHAPGARSVAKPKPAARAYNPYNDPEILKAEAVANMSLPSADLAHQLSAARTPWHPGLFNKKTLLSQVIDAKTFAPYEGHARQDALWAGIDYINAVGDGIGYIIQHPMNAVRGLGVLGNETYRYLSSHGIDVESDHYFHTMGDNISATLSAALNYDPRAVGTLISIPFGAGLGSRLGSVTNLNEMAASAALKGTEYTAKAVKLAGAHTARAAKAVMQQSARIGKSAARFFGGGKDNKILDWSRVGRDGRTAAAHILDNHGNLKLSKEVQGVFYGHPIEVIEDAWQKANSLNVEPIKMGNRDVYLIPRANSGYAGGYSGQLVNYDHITIITEAGTSRIVTGFPSGRTPQLPNKYNFTFEVDDEYQNTFRR